MEEAKEKVTNFIISWLEIEDNRDMLEDEFYNLDLCESRELLNDLFTRFCKGGF